MALRGKLKEPEIWRASRAHRQPGALEIFRGVLLRRTLLGSALAAAVLFAYWGLFTWIPGFLSASREMGGAGLSIVKTSGFVVPMQLGAFAGYVAFGWLSDRLGRRPAFVLYVLGAALLTPIYGATHDERTLLRSARLSGFSAPASSACSGRCWRNSIRRPARRGPGLCLQHRPRTQFDRPLGGGILRRPLWDWQRARAQFGFFHRRRGVHLHASRNEAGRA